MDRFGYGVNQNSRDIESLIKNNYKWSISEDGNPKGLTYIPKISKKGNKIILKLKDNALDHAQFIEDSFSGSLGQLKDNIFYEVDGKLHKYNMSLFSGPSLKSV
tara:strand:- start:1848 stop:2159 length:312 start_codon:yes stop_codon:yes gene_type:complete